MSNEQNQILKDLLKNGLGIEFSEEALKGSKGKLVSCAVSLYDQLEQTSNRTTPKGHEPRRG